MVGSSKFQEQLNKQKKMTVKPEEREKYQQAPKNCTN